MRQFKNLFKSPSSKGKNTCQTCGKLLDNNELYCNVHAKEDSEHASLNPNGTGHNKNKLKTSDNHSSSEYSNIPKISSNNNDGTTSNANDRQPNATSAISREEETDKVMQLQSMFDTMNEEAIRVCLRDCNYDVERAVDTLLNLNALLPQRKNTANATEPVTQTTNNSNTDQSPYVAINKIKDNTNVVNRNGNSELHSNSNVSNTTTVSNNNTGNHISNNSNNGNSKSTTIEEELMKGVQEGNSKFIIHFMKNIKPYLTKDVQLLMDNCLLNAIQCGNNNLVQLFIENGANFNGNETQLYTPLLLSIEIRQIEIAYLLIKKYKVDCNVNGTGTSFSPLQLAIKYNEINLIQLLLDNNANINYIDIESGKTSIFIAFEQRQFETIKLLIKYNINLTVQDKLYNETILHVAIRNCNNANDLLLLSLLLQQSKIQDKFNIDKQDINGNTILHIAIQRSVTPISNSTTLLDLLLPYFPNPYLLNNQNTSPYQLLLNSNKSILIQQFKEYIEKYNKLDSNNSNNNKNNIINDDDDGSDDENQLRDSRKLTRSNNNDNDNNNNSSEEDEDYKLVSAFSEHIEKVISDDWEVTVEFSEIENTTADANLVGDFTSALQPHNLFKNRYRNILPYEGTRVKLKEIEGMIGSDFISANWISGETNGTEHSYIATQGPLQHTVEDFWRMVWEQNVNVVVMLSNLLENGREKVWQYWPEGDSIMHLNQFQIQLQNSTTDEQLIRRFIVLTEKETQKKKNVTHIQYISWPDHGLPEHEHGFAQILDLVENENINQAPIVVHCSAGIGRTGTFCIAHSNWLKLKLLLWSSTTDKFDLKKSVLRMREQRAGMIQTKDQYLYCYISLQEKVTKYKTMLAYKNQRWFHKGVETNQANQLLQNKSNGTFLVYPSNERNTITVGVVKNSIVNHLSIIVQDKGFYLAPSGQLFNTVSNLLKSDLETFKTPLFK